MNMKYVKNLIMIILFAQCLLLFYACDKKEATTVETIAEPTEQNIMNLADFVKCPFNEGFNGKTNLEKYVLKKFGKPDKVVKGRDALGDADSADIVVDRIWLEYTEEDPGDKYSFTICRGVSKRFEVLERIYICKYTDLKYGINEETTIRDIENLFGRPRKVQNIQREENDTASDIHYRYAYSDGPYVYHLSFGFRKEKLNSIGININISF